MQWCFHSVIDLWDLELCFGVCVEDLEVDSVLDSGIHSVISSVNTPAMDSEARGCAGPKEKARPGPAVVLFLFSLNESSQQPYELGHIASFFK